VRRKYRAALRRDPGRKLFHSRKSLRASLMRRKTVSLIPLKTITLLARRVVEYLQATAWLPVPRTATTAATDSKHVQVISCLANGPDFGLIEEHSAVVKVAFPL
jgi:hypothetical protein